MENTKQYTPGKEENTRRQRRATFNSVPTDRTTVHDFKAEMVEQALGRVFSTRLLSSKEGDTQKLTDNIDHLLRRTDMSTKAAT